MAVGALVRGCGARLQMRLHVVRRNQLQSDGFLVDRRVRDGDVGNDHLTAEAGRRFEDMADLRRCEGDGDLCLYAWLEGFGRGSVYSTGDVDREDGDSELRQPVNEVAPCP